MILVTSDINNSSHNGLTVVKHESLTRSNFVRVSFLIVVILLVGEAQMFSQPPSAKPRPGVVVLSSADAPGSVSVDRLNNCLRLLAHDWKQNEKKLPAVLVIHVSKKAARAVMLEEQKVVVRHNRATDQSDLYYEVWLVDTPSIDNYILALENVIEDYFQLTPTNEERTEVMKRVARVQSATISAYEGK